MRIRNLLCLLFIFTISCYSQNFWEKIESPTTDNLISVEFIDSLTGWAASDSGLIIKTTDGGDSWTTQYNNDSLIIVNLCFLNDQFGIASATSSLYEPFGTYLLKTTDGGNNWSSKYLRIGDAYVNSISFIDSLTGFAVGYPSFFLKTTDGGDSWRAVHRDSSQYAGWPPETVKFFSSTYGYACGGTRDAVGVIWKTTDRGDNWITLVDSSSAPAEPLYAIQFFDSLNVLVMGGDPEFGASLMKTTNTGSTWEYQNLGILWNPVDVGFRTAEEGWAPIGPRFVFLFTSDSGHTWTQLETPDSTNISYISFPDSSHGFAVGDHGAIIKYTYHKPNEVNSEPAAVKSFLLSQNYPNPFNPVTTISYQLPDGEFVSLKVYDVLGREVVSLVNDYKPAGKYGTEFDAGNLSSGIYFYRFRSGSFSITKKMLLLR